MSDIPVSSLYDLEDFEDVDDDFQDIFQIPTQNLLFKRDSNSVVVSHRFGRNVSEPELAKQRNERIPKKTRQNILFAMNVWRSWAENRNLKPQTVLEQYTIVPIDIVTTSEAELNFWLSRFVNELGAWPLQDIR